MAGDKTLLTLGRVRKAHALRGELVAEYHGEDWTSLASLPRLFLARPPAAPRAFVVRGVRELGSSPGLILLRLEGLDDRTAAEAWRGADLLADAADLPPLEEDEFYLEDLLGLQVVLPDGAVLGVLEQFLATAPDYDLWVVRDPAGGEILFPGREEFLMEIDTEAGRIVINPPPGLVELAAATSGPRRSPRPAAGKDRRDRRPAPREHDHDPHRQP